MALTALRFSRQTATRIYISEFISFLSIWAQNPFSFVFVFFLLFLAVCFVFYQWQSADGDVTRPHKNKNNSAICFFLGSSKRKSPSDVPLPKPIDRSFWFLQVFFFFAFLKFIILRCFRFDGRRPVAAHTLRKTCTLKNQTTISSLWPSLFFHSTQKIYFFFKKTTIERGEIYRRL